MKKSLLAFLIALTTAASATAQLPDITTSRNELRLGIGNWSYPQLFTGIKNEPYRHNQYPIDVFSGVYSLSYKYFVTDRIAVGVSATFQMEGGHCQNVFYTGVFKDYSIYGVFIRRELTVAPEVTFVYTGSNSRKASVIAYGYIGAGVCFQRGHIFTGDYTTPPPSISVSKIMALMTDKRELAMGHICPIGITYGGRLRGFAELGFGYKGIFNMGIMLKV